MPIRQTILWTGISVIAGGHLSWGSSATALEGWAGWFVDRGKSRLGRCANGADPCWPFHDGE